jgi:hypothetical protein
LQRVNGSKKAARGEANDGGRTSAKRAVSGNQSRGDNGYWNVSKMVLLSELAAHLESGRLRIINPPMGQELISELNSCEVDFTPAGNTCGLTCARRTNHGDLVIATALALWSAVGKPSGAIQIGKLDGWY